MKSPATLMRGASATLLLRLKSCSPTTENWFSSTAESVESSVRDQVVFAVLVVSAGRGQRLPAHALVLPGPVLVAVLHVAGVAFAELVRGAHAELGVAGGRGNIGLEGAGGVRRRGRNGRAHHGVQVLLQRG